MNEQFEPISRDTLTHQLTNAWLSFGDIFVNPLFFTRGIVLVSPNEQNDTLVSPEHDSFVINEREFTFYHPTQTRDKRARPDPRALKKTTTLFNTLIDFALTQQANIKPIEDKPVVLFNKYRRDETFLPLMFGQSAQHIGLYLYPWLAKANRAFSFSGFSQFVTAGCLFGGALRGILDDGHDVTLIDHQLQLPAGQKITAIAYDEEADNPFEQVLFAEFEKTCFVINAFAKPGAVQLLYHLPSWDYILFGLKLLIKQQMTYAALADFVSAIVAKRQEYLKQLYVLGQKHQIAIQVQSPFDNLFGDTLTNHTLDGILHQLKLNKDDHVTGKNTADGEQQLVQQCLTLLTTNTYHSGYQTVWQDVMAVGDHIPTDLEHLFKMANAVMVANASRGHAHYETCSLLPLSEKQIQVHYERWRSRLEQQTTTNHYPLTFNLTTFEPVVTYAPTTKGLLFYLSCGLQSLSSLIVHHQVGLLAAQNIGLFAANHKKTTDDLSESSEKNTVSLHDILVPTPKPLAS